MARPRSWSDDDLREAAAKAESLAQVVRALRLGHGGAAYITVRSRMEQLGISLGRPGGNGATRSSAESGGARGSARGWTEAALRDAVAAGRSLNDVFARLGLTVGGSQWLVIRALIVDRGWSTDHWDCPLHQVQEPGQRGTDFRGALDDADLVRVAGASRSRADLIRALGFSPDSTTYRLLREELLRQGVSDEHFEPAHAAMRRVQREPQGQPLTDILVRDSTYTSIATLKNRLVEVGLLVPECAGCGLRSWRGRTISLHLDHVNGIRDDHRLENLRLLCPNCHSQTDTYCGRNRGRYAAREQSEPLR